MSSLKESKKIKNFSKKTYSQTRTNTNLSPRFKTKEDLSKNIFYACTNCGGALVPIAICSICNRTTMRQCVECEKYKQIGFHEVCKDLVDFENIVIQKDLQGETS